MIKIGGGAPGFGEGARPGFRL